MVRSLQPSDVSEVVRIHDASHLIAQFPIGPRWSQSQIEDECRTGCGWVSEGALGELEAFILYRDMKVAWEITFLASDPRLRRKGAMERLLASVLTKRPAGFEVWLEVHEENVPARRLYEKLGFREVGRRLRYYLDGGAACVYNYG